MSSIIHFISSIGQEITSFEVDQDSVSEEHFDWCKRYLKKEFNSTKDREGNDLYYRSFSNEIINVEILVNNI